MGALFNPEGPFFKFMERVADYFIINILTVLCSLPVITIGAAFTSMHKVLQNMAMDNEQPVFRSYFKSFKENFKQATILWLIVMLIVAFLLTDLFVIFVYLDGNITTILYVLVGAVSFISLGTVTYAFPLIARYENTLKQHIRNGLILAVANLPKTVLMLALYAIPVVLAILNFEAFFNTMVFWTLLGFSLLSLGAMKLLKPIFVKLEAQNAPPEDTEE